MLTVLRIELNKNNFYINLTGKFEVLIEILWLAKIAPSVD